MNQARLFCAIICLLLSACWTRPTDFEQSANRAAASSQSSCVNLNTASVQDLMRLPAIGEVLAKRIVEHREKHGPFRRPQDIIIIEGISENKYRAIADMVCVSTPSSRSEN